MATRATTGAANQRDKEGGELSATAKSPNTAFEGNATAVAACLQGYSRNRGSSQTSCDSRFPKRKRRGCAL